MHFTCIFLHVLFCCCSLFQIINKLRTLLLTPKSSSWYTLDTTAEQLCLCSNGFCVFVYNVDKGQGWCEHLQPLITPSFSLPPPSPSPLSSPPATFILQPLHLPLALREIECVCACACSCVSLPPLLSLSIFCMRVFWVMWVLLISCRFSPSTRARTVLIQTRESAASSAVG